MIILAGIAYVFGPLFGADFSGRMRVWAGNLVASTFVVAGILLLMVYIFPNFLGVQSSFSSYFGVNNLPGLIGYLLRASNPSNWPDFPDGYICRTYVFVCKFLWC